MKLNFIPALLLVLPSLLVSKVSLASELLLTAKQVDSQCELAVWNPQNLESSDLVNMDQCPDRLFVSESTSAVIFVDGKGLVRLPLRKNTQPEVIASIPEFTLSKIADEAFGRPLTDYEKMTASRVMPVRNAGALEDGTPWLHVGIVMAGDDDYDFLFRLVDGDWVFEEFVHCGRFEACGFATLGKMERNSGNSDIVPQLWDGSVTDNPYHVRDELVSTSEGGYRELVRNDRFFIVDGREVSLEVWSGAGPDTGFPYLVGAVLHIGNSDKFVICETQCSATLTGRFLLARRFWGGTLELYDIATGRSILGPLTHAVWIENPSHETSD